MTAHVVWSWGGTSLAPSDEILFRKQFCVRGQLQEHGLHVLQGLARYALVFLNHAYAFNHLAHHLVSLLFHRAWHSSSSLIPGD